MVGWETDLLLATVGLNVTLWFTVCRIRYYQNLTIFSKVGKLKTLVIMDGRVHSRYYYYFFFFLRKKYIRQYWSHRVAARVWTVGIIGKRSECRSKQSGVDLWGLCPLVPLLLCPFCLVLPCFPSFIQSSAFSHFPISRCLSMSFSFTFSFFARLFSFLFLLH